MAWRTNTDRDLQTEKYGQTTDGQTDGWAGRQVGGQAGRRVSRQAGILIRMTITTKMNPMMALIYE